MRIPLFKPVIDEEAIQAVCDVLRSGWLVPGPKTQPFEKAFAKYIGIAFCVGVDTGTFAPHRGLHFLELSPGSEVIIKVLTFVSAYHAILFERSKLGFADTQYETGNFDVKSVKNCITERTGAILLLNLHFQLPEDHVDYVSGLIREGW